MTTLAEIISQRLAEIGRGPSQAESIGKLGKNYVSDIVHGRKSDVRSKNIPPLAKALDWSTAELLLALKRSGLRFGENEISDPEPGDAVVTPRPPQQPAGMAYYGDDVPILGVAAASVVGSFKIEGKIDAVKRPPGMMNAKNIYALYVHGDSMSPRYYTGDLIFVSPDRPPRAGDDVIIQTKTHEGAPVESWLKQLDQPSANAVVARQLNPPSKIDFKRPTVVAVHRVLTMRELFGV